MIVEAQVSINGSRQAIWDTITNIENASDTISGIDKIEILERPDNGLMGLKWRETRTIFGKSATEDMWITDVAENKSFESRAESHGCLYITTKYISEQNGKMSLISTHDSQPQSLMAKLLFIPMGIACKGMMKKALMKDLNDIKAAIESK